MRLTDLTELVTKLRERLSDDIDIDIRIEAGKTDDFIVRLAKDETVETCWYSFSCHTIDQGVDHLEWAYNDCAEQHY